MRLLSRLTLAAAAFADPVVPELPPSAIHSPEQLAALRGLVTVGRTLTERIDRGDARRLTDLDLAGLADGLNWLDTLRHHTAPVDQPADAAALWTVADACKMVLPQLRALCLAAETRDTVGVDKWAGRASVSLALLGAALRGCQ